MREPMHALPRLRELRIAKGNTIRGLAEAAHVSTETLFRAERGGKVRTTTRDSLAEALGLDHPWRLVFEDSAVDKALEEDNVENAILRQRMLDMTSEDWEEFLDPGNPRVREVRHRLLSAIEATTQEREELERQNARDAS